MMFRLLDFELVHWDFWQRIRVPLNASIVTIVGPNGSGKTTLLDGLRTLLTLDCSKRRDYKRYARRNGEEFCWLRGVVDNTRSPSGRHPFFPILTDRVTLACRIEKKGGDWVRQYCIAEGEVAIEQIRDHGVWMGIREYQRRLEGAGLTPSIAHVLSLEQGQTDKLCELSPKALLDLVFYVFEDKQVLDRYQEARLHQEATARELAEIDGQLARLQLKIDHLDNQVRSLRQYQALQRERAQLVSEIKPRVEFVQLADSARRARAQLIAARRDWRIKRAEQIQQAAVMPALDAEIASAQAGYARIEGEEQEAIAGLSGVNKTIGALEQTLKERDRLTRLALAAGATDAEGAAQRLGKAEQERAATERSIADMLAEIATTEELLRLLDSGQRADPHDVRDLRAALDESGIAHDLLPEIVQILDESWQGAVEAVLAPFRHVVLLTHAEDRDRAFVLGERRRYRHFLVPERVEIPLPTPGSLLEVLRFKRPAPPWLIQLLDRTQRVEDAEAGARQPQGQDWTTRAGYLRERRGGRYAGVKPSDYHFGRARATALRETLLQIRNRLAEAEAAREEHRHTADRERALLMGFDAAKDLALRAEEFAGAESELANARALARRQEERLARLREERERANTKLRTAIQERNAVSNKLDTLARTMQELQQPAAREEQKNRVTRLRHDRRRWSFLRDAEVNAAQIAKWESVAAVQREIERIEQRLQTEEWMKDETVVALRDKLREDHARQSEEQRQRSLENKRARALTDAAREAYIDVLRATVRRYAKNLRALGEIANVKVEAALPPLINDDVALNQAGLEVKFDFDSKGFIGMNDGDASGGQQVMKSLILLIALMMEDSRPGGFVFIDEPFAHLDIFNIDRVASFLGATQAQYLITTPITHNVNVYDPAMLTLVTFKKRAGEPWAPRIGKLVRDAIGQPH